MGTFKASINARVIAVVLLVTGLLLGTVALAGAGVIDTPLPTLGGANTSLVFTVPGVIKNNNLETAFICTSLEFSKTVRVGVEVFAATGGAPLNDVNVFGSEDLLPGETKTIATGATVGLHEDDVITLPPASLRNGSARIISTSKKIACTAFVLDEISDPPISMVPLSLISKKQRGD